MNHLTEDTRALLRAAQEVHAERHGSQTFTSGTHLPLQAAGERPQLFVPGNTFHTSRLVPGGEAYALLASTEWPGVEPPDVEHGDVEELAVAYPEMGEQIRAFTR